MGTAFFSAPVFPRKVFGGAVMGVVDHPTVAATGALSATSTANVIVIPTSNPGVAGAIWNDGGTLSGSAG